MVVVCYTQLFPTGFWVTLKLDLEKAYLRPTGHYCWMTILLLLPPPPSHTRTHLPDSRRMYLQFNERHTAGVEDCKIRQAECLIRFFKEAENLYGGGNDSSAIQQLCRTMQTCFLGIRCTCVDLDNPASPPPPTTSPLRRPLMSYAVLLH